ncbi:hypothetical protein CPB84DRAFT_1935394 [Gymnopilus junonius]|uniref:Alpha/beta hydrolase fold-3 domain-containing protein n=1 Tax=Gymnopilus junonius TaxID=109634 RepID=A0A9P5NJM5_GYMJU|nr:hypothetical protein CPB84DRAFT_1935394 [Gymnopilus junonius]
MGSSSSMKRHVAFDCVEPIIASGYTLRALLGNLPESQAPKNVWVAPGSVELDHKPVVLKKRLVEDLGSGNVAWVESPDGTHDFLTISWFELERTEAYKEVAKWVGDEVWPAGQVL